MQRLRRLINELLRDPQWRDRAVNKLALELNLALENLLEQLGLVLQRSQ